MRQDKKLGNAAGQKMDGPNQHLIVYIGQQAVMKPRVGGHPCRNMVGLTAEMVQKFLHSPEIVFREQMAGGRHSPAFQNAAAGERIQNFPRRERGDGFTFLRRGHYQALAFQKRQRFAHRSPADAQAFGQLRLFDAVAGFQRAPQQIIFDNFDNLVTVQLFLNHPDRSFRPEVTTLTLSLEEATKKHKRVVRAERPRALAKITKKNFRPR